MKNFELEKFDFCRCCQVAGEKDKIFGDSRDEYFIKPRSFESSEL